MKTSITKHFPLILVALGVVAYANSFQGAFVLDDTPNILENTRIRHLLPAGASDWFGWRPFATLTFALNYATGGLNPADYHATNLLIHLSAGLLLYGIIGRTLMLPTSGKRFKARASQLAFVSSAIWLVHPLTTSSVTYVCQRYEILMAMFYLLTLYCVIRGTSSRQWPGYVAAVIACMLGMASKEVMITAPVLVLLYDRIFLAHSFKEVFARRWALHVCMAATWIFLGFLMFAAIPKSVSVSVYGGRPSLSYILTQCGVILHYLRLAFWPHGLCVDYAWPAAESLGTVLPSLIPVCTLGLATLAAMRYYPAAGYIGASFFIILSPTSSFVPQPDAAFEHRMYLPLAAVVAGTVIGVYDIIGRISVEKRVLGRYLIHLAIVLAAIAVIALSIGTHQRNRAYRSQETIWRDTIANRPDNIRAYINLASALYDTRRYEESIGICGKALARLPDLAKMSHAELLRRKEMPDAGKLYFQVFHYVGLHNTVGLACHARGETEKALKHFGEALRLAPGNWRAHNNLGAALFALNRPAEAMTHWQHSLVAAPKNAAAHRYLAEALMAMGQQTEAVEHYHAALQSAPDDLMVKGRLAWILATSTNSRLRDGQTALIFASDVAKSVNYRSVRSLDILAAAYAEAGAFSNAVATAQQALQLRSKMIDTNDGSAIIGHENRPVAALRTDTGPDTSVESIKDRLRLYREEQPFRAGTRP